MKCRDCGEEYEREERYVFQRCPHCGEFQLPPVAPVPSPEAVRALVEAARRMVRRSRGRSYAAGMHEGRTMGRDMDDLAAALAPFAEPGT